MSPLVSKVSSLLHSLEPHKPLAPFTSWRIGGLADHYIAPRSESEIQDVLALAHGQKLPLTLLGGGSNVLLSDEGIRGIVMHMNHHFAGFSFLPEGRVRAQAGVRLGTLIKKAMAQKLAGIEQLWGIPGTIGGAVAMNAGACNTEFFDVVEEITSLTPAGEKVVRKRADIAHGYRWSDYKFNGEIVIDALIRLHTAPAERIQESFDAADRRRQPQHNIRQPNCGSVFRNPEGDYAGRLIQVLGAKGRQLGNAQVSLDHANFIVNTGKASARDTCLLIRSLQADVKALSGIHLEPEVIFLGAF